MHNNIELGRPARSGQLILERRWRIAERLLAEYSPNSVMLDLGCGNGSQTEFFRNRFSKLYAFDYINIRKSEQPISLDRIRFVQGDAGKLPFASESVDVVTSFEVLEHVPDDIVAICEVNRILKRDGCFLFSVPNRYWVFESHGAKVKGFNWLPWNRIPFVSWLPKPIHSKIAKARIYTISSLTQVIDKMGFKVVDSGYITAPMDVLPNGKLRDMLRNSVFKGDITKFPFLAVNLYMKCIKL